MYSCAGIASTIPNLAVCSFDMKVSLVLNFLDLPGLPDIEFRGFYLLNIQRYYFSTAKELIRISGTTKSSVVNHLAESIAGAMTIRAFGEEDRFFSHSLDLIDANASPYFHSFSANEWLIQCLEIPCALVLSASALAMTLFPLGASSSGNSEIYFQLRLQIIYFTIHILCEIVFGQK
jgi:ABC-type multidrug transport system fused ATPase/permease subunit